MSKKTVRDPYGKILGTLEDTGDRIVARDFYGVILGSYRKNDDTTRDFYGRIITKGNAVIGLIMNSSKE